MKLNLKDNKNKIYKGAVYAVKKINDNNFLSVLVTNQPAVAKGVISLDKLKEDHKKLEYHFGLKGAYFDRIYFCPYHPERGFRGEIKKFKKESIGENLIMVCFYKLLKFLILI